MGEEMKLSNETRLDLMSAKLEIAISALKDIAVCAGAPAIDVRGQKELALHCFVEDMGCVNRYEGANCGHAVGVEKSLEWASNEAASALKVMGYEYVQITCMEKTTKSPDSNVEKNRELLLQRSIAGVEKYGCTTDKNNLELVEWLQHALEESLDMANYLQAAIARLDNQKRLKSDV